MRRSITLAGPYLPCLAAFAGAIATPASGGVDFQGLGFLAGGANSYAHAVSGDGTTVVGHADVLGNPVENQAFRWTKGGGMVGLGYLPGDPDYPSSDAWCVSFDGSVIAGDSAGAFRWTKETGMVDLGALYPDLGSSVRAMSSDGTVIGGWSRTVEGHDVAARWTLADGWAHIGNLGIDYGIISGISSDGSVAVGTSINTDDIDEAFRWTSDGGMVGLGGFPDDTRQSYAYAVSSEGNVVVGLGIHAPDGGYQGSEAFRWTEEDGMIGLGQLGDFPISVATCVSADGSAVAGWAYTDKFPGHEDEAFVWTADTGMVNLRDALLADGADVSGWVLKKATGISADGRTIVGDGVNPFGHSEAWIATIPAPATSTLGALTLLAARRRR